MSGQNHSVAMNHDAAWELLPWYINGTLQASERALVDVHVRTCLLCHREVDEQRQLHELVRESDTVRISPRSSFETLMRRIDSGVSADTGRSIGYRARVAAWLPIAATLLAASVLLIVLFSASPDRDGEFQTLTSDTPSRQYDLPALQMVFTEQVTQEDIRSIVAAVGGRIVDGPSGAGVYTIGLVDGPVPAGTLEQLRADERIRFIGQSYAGPSP